MKQLSGRPVTRHEGDGPADGLVNDGPILDSIGIEDQHLIEIVG